MMRGKNGNIEVNETAGRLRRDAKGAIGTVGTRRPGDDLVVLAAFYADSLMTSALNHSNIRNRTMKLLNGK